MGYAATPTERQRATARRDVPEELKGMISAADWVGLVQTHAAFKARSNLGSTCHVLPLVEYCET